MYQIAFSKPGDNEWWHLAGLGDDLEFAVRTLLDRRAVSAHPANPHFGWRYKLVHHVGKDDVYAVYNVDEGTDVLEENITAIAFRGVHA